MEPFSSPEYQAHKVLLEPFLPSAGTRCYFDRWLGQRCKTVKPQLHLFQMGEGIIREVTWIIQVHTVLDQSPLIKQSYRSLFVECLPTGIFLRTRKNEFSFSSANHLNSNIGWILIATCSFDFVSYLYTPCTGKAVIRLTMKPAQSSGCCQKYWILACRSRATVLHWFHV
jgi:hypothetical protein